MDTFAGGFYEGTIGDKTAVYATLDGVRFKPFDGGLSRFANAFDRLVPLGASAGPRCCQTVVNINLDHGAILGEILQQLREQRNLIMSLQDQTSTIAAAVDAAKASTDAALDRIAVDVAELKARAEAGAEIPAADFDAIIAKLGAIKSSTDAADPLPDFPATPPAE